MPNKAKASASTPVSDASGSTQEQLLSNELEMQEEAASPQNASLTDVDETVDELMEQFPERSTYVVQDGEFSNVGKPIPVFDDGNRSYDDDKRPIYEVGRYNYDVTINGKIVGRFKHTEPTVNWALCKLAVRHYTNEAGVNYLWFTVFHKKDTVAQVTNFVSSKPLLEKAKALY